MLVHQRVILCCKTRFSKPILQQLKRPSRHPRRLSWETMTTVFSQFFRNSSSQVTACTSKWFVGSSSSNKSGCTWERTKSLSPWPFFRASDVDVAWLEIWSQIVLSRESWSILQVCFCFNQVCIILPDLVCNFACYQPLLYNSGMGIWKNGTPFRFSSSRWSGQKSCQILGLKLVSCMPTIPLNWS